jgi:hypothetical protein
LHTIAFQLSVVLPFTHVYRLARSVLGENDEKQTKLVVETAWTFVTERSVVSSFFLFLALSVCFSLRYVSLMSFDVFMCVNGTV